MGVKEELIVYYSNFLGSDSESTQGSREPSGQIRALGSYGHRAFLVDQKIADVIIIWCQIIYKRIGVSAKPIDLVGE